MTASRTASLRSHQGPQHWPLVVRRGPPVHCRGTLLGDPSTWRATSLRCSPCLTHNQCKLFLLHSAPCQIRWQSWHPGPRLTGWAPWPVIPALQGALAGLPGAACQVAPLAAQPEPAQPEPAACQSQALPGHMHCMELLPHPAACRSPAWRPRLLSRMPPRLTNIDKAPVVLDALHCPPLGVLLLLLLGHLGCLPPHLSGTS